MEDVSLAMSISLLLISKFLSLLSFACGLVGFVWDGCKWATFYAGHCCFSWCCLWCHEMVLERLSSFPFSSSSVKVIYSLHDFYSVLSGSSFLVAIRPSGGIYLEGHVYSPSYLTRPWFGPANSILLF